MFRFCSFKYSCPVFPIPLIEETVISPLYILNFFVINYLTIGLCVYFLAFCQFPLIYISDFVTIPCCFDHCIFVVYSEVREPDSSSSIFLSQDFFGYLGSFLFPYK